MRILIVTAVLFVIGMVGLVVFSELDRTQGQATRARPVHAALGTKITTISHGEAVTIEDHLTPGQWNVVEFTADW